MSANGAVYRYFSHALTCSSRSTRSTRGIERTRIRGRRTYSDAQAFAFKKPDLSWRQYGLKQSPHSEPLKHKTRTSKFSVSSSTSRTTSAQELLSPSSPQSSLPTPALEEGPQSESGSGSVAHQGEPDTQTPKDMSLYEAHSDLFSTYLDSLFPPLQFPRELTERILTHGSHPAAIHGHNAQLSFMGRRVLESYLLLLLSSSPSLREEHDLAYIASRALDANVLGEEVGVRRWNLGGVVRWTPAVERDVLEKARSTTSEDDSAEVEILKGRGLYRVTGETVAAIFGGIYRQWGASTAHRTFHLHLLPHLLPRLPKVFSDDVHRMRDQVDSLGLLNEKRAQNRKVLAEEIS